MKKDKKKEEVKEELPKDVESTEDDIEEVVEEISEEDKEVNKDEEIENLKNEVARLKNAYAMAYADTENTRKRLTQEAESTRKYRIQSFALEVLPIIDNLERALDAHPDKEDSFYVGIKMIYDQLVNALKNEGVTEIDCLNQKFDPNLEQSIVQEKKEGVESGVVIEVFQKGYMLKDRILRASMVKVSE